MPSISISAVEKMAAQVVVKTGASQRTAADVAEHLVLAERSGHASHGLSILPNYVAAARAGMLVAKALPQCVVDSGAMLAFDGHRAYGQHAGKVAVTHAIANAKANKFCFLTLRNSYHLGRAGHYGEMASKEGIIYLSFISVVGMEPMVAPFGGAQARLSTNPLCFAIPLSASMGESPGSREPLILDYATSSVAANKVRLFAARDEELKPGLMIDNKGNPTCDPHALFANPPGALLPFGAHKGYALGMVAELLAGVLSGGGTIAPHNARDGGMENNLFAILIDPGAFGDRNWELNESQAFVDYVTGCPPIAGIDHVMLPGAPEAENQRKNVNAFDMSDAAWTLFAACANESGLSADACLLATL